MHMRVGVHMLGRDFNIVTAHLQNEFCGKSAGAVHNFES